MIIAIEGAAGCGKSTLVDLIVATGQLGSAFQTPPEPLRGIRSIVESECSAQARFLFNALGVKIAVDRAKIAQKETAIFDRYIYSSFIYSGLSIASREVALILKMTNIPTPDLILILESDESIRQARLNSRYRGAPSQKFRCHIDAITSTDFRSAYVAHNFPPAYHISTDHVDALQTLKKAESLIQGIRSAKS